MESQDTGDEEAPQVAVSSLRSRFENLGKIHAGSASPLVARSRSPMLPTGSATSQERPAGMTRQTTWAASYAPRPVDRDLTITPMLRSSPPRSRPISMMASPPLPQVKPTVTVESPRPLDRKHAMSIDLGAARFMPVPPSLDAGGRGLDSPTRSAARTPSRAGTPALEARLNELYHAATAPPIPSSDPGNTASLDMNGISKAKTSKPPPPVNRAGKPLIPLKPTTLTAKPEAIIAGRSLDVPDPRADITDRSLSPFNTPPGSGANSPKQRAGFDDGSQRKDSDGSLSAKPRGDSDASWVERVRTNSSTSSFPRERLESDTTYLARMRAGSNASFVEPSTLPDSWHYSQSTPSPQTPLTKLDEQRNGTARPARYHPIGSRDRTAAGDLPEVLPDRPRLPARPELQRRPSRSTPPKVGARRISPVRRVTAQRSVDGIARAATSDTESAAPRIPANKPDRRSALMQGFGTIAAAPTRSTHIAPAAPAPRRSMDRRRDVTALPEAAPDSEIQDEVLPLDVAPFGLGNEQKGSFSDYPDSSRSNRRPPKFSQRPWSIPTEYDTRTFAVCGEYVCTTGHRTKAWNIRTGEQLLDMEHHEILRVSSLVFKPAASPEHEGRRVWLGTSIGEIHELDILDQSIVNTRTGVHTRREIIRMFRHASEVWTLDDNGELNVWKPDKSGIPSLDSQCKSFRTPRGHTFSIALGSRLWIAIGKQIHIFEPGAGSDAEFRVLSSPLSQPAGGEICSGATLSMKPELVFFGHNDGKVSIYNRNDFSCVEVINVSTFKISTMAGGGDYLWIGFNAGSILVYDTTAQPWRVIKDWQAHEKQISGMTVNKSAMGKLDRLQVVTLGADSMLRIWDGMLQYDRFDIRMQEHDQEYCMFREITTATLTWNAGASKPQQLQTNRDDNFFREYLDAHEGTDIFVFGFQELVDLDDKKLTAKTFFKRKTNANEQEHMSHQHRAWRDCLTQCIDDFTPPSQSYVQLHSASLVGLFTCVFIKAALRSRIRHVQAAEVKRGIGGIYGNKGALVLRLVLDDSSLCFVNCHLAAGQTQTIHRNNDIAAILESETLPAYPLTDESGVQHADVFSAGGDGSMIVDHEICILNGDLNYRIDTMGRDTVIKHVKSNNFSRLLERDQLLLSRRKNPGFRLRAFQENEIRFAPTYKYNVHSDEYDTSEKRRAPAWCDRILYRGLGQVKCEEYRRWEVRVSDHRPVSGRFRLRVKSVDAVKRKRVADAVGRELEEVKRRISRAVQSEYLTDVLGLSPRETSAALNS